MSCSCRHPSFDHYDNTLEVFATGDGGSCPDASVSSDVLDEASAASYLLDSSTAGVLF
jgi:hypothetical protein